MTISWDTGTNARGAGQIKVNLRYSADDGETWQPLAVGLTETSLDLTLSQLPASENGLLEVIATNSTQSQSRQLELGQIGNKAPQVGILNQGKIQLYPATSDPWGLLRLQADLLLQTLLSNESTSLRRNPKGLLRKGSPF